MNLKIDLSSEDKWLAGISVGFAVLLCLVFVFTPIDYVLGFFFLLMEALFVFFLTRKYPNIAKQLWLAFSLRAFVMLLQAFVVSLPSTNSDANRFEEMGYAWSQYGPLGTFQFFDLSRSYIYSWFIAFMYSLTDRSPMMIQAVNVLLGVGVVLNFYKTCLLLWGKSCAESVTWVLCFFPPMILYSAITLREIPLIFLFSGGLFLAARWFKENQILDFIFALCLLVGAGFFHGAILLVVPLFLIAFVLRSLRSMLVGRAKSLVLFVILGLVIFNVVILFVSLKVGGSKLFSLYSDSPIDSVMHRMNDASQKSSDASLHPKVKLDGVADLILFLPRYFAFFLFAPFPWMVQRIYDLERALVGVFWFCMFIAAFFNLRAIFSRSVTIFLFSALGLLVVVFSIGSGDYNTGYRHKNKLLPIALLITAPYLDRFFRRFTFR